MLWQPTKRALRRTELDLLRQVVQHGVIRWNVKSRMAGRVRWPYALYLLSEDLRFIYCPVPKVASGNLKRWLLSESGIPEDAWKLHPFYGINPYATQTLRLDDDRKCFDPAYFRAAFVRNPFYRVVSAFLDKFVLPLSGSREWQDSTSARPVLTWLERRRGYADRTDATFEHFVDFICAAPDLALDDHWLPQTHFLGDADFDFIGKLESFERDFEELRTRIGAKTPLTLKKPRLSYARSEKGYSGDIPIRELARMPAYPKALTFYSPETVLRVAKRYAVDFERFGYSTTLQAT